MTGKMNWQKAAAASRWAKTNRFFQIDRSHDGPATTKQLAYLNSLAAKLNRKPHVHVSKREASMLIDYYKDLLTNHQQIVLPRSGKQKPRAQQHHNKNTSQRKPYTLYTPHRT